MITIYAVTWGGYSDYKVIGLFSSKKLAEAFMEAFAHRDMFNEIEEYPLDSFIPQIREELKPYWVYMKPDGEVIEAFQANPSNFDGNAELRSDSLGISAQCFAKDREHAIKIANERRVQLIAAGKCDEHG